jgi:phospholipid/cholesterol/gamma-HCH transport system permease protein
MKFIAGTGSAALARLREVNYIGAVLLAVVAAAINPRTWRRTVRQALSRQIVSTGVEALGFVSLISLLVGLLVVVQVQLWVVKVAYSRMLGPVLVTVVIRELGPLMTNLVLIARSGNAITAELANMRISGEVRALEAQGIDPFIYLVVPRVLGAAISTFCLTMIFILASLTSGYICARLMNVRAAEPTDFASSIARAIGGEDVLNVFIKSIIPALLWGAICCIEGLAVGETPSEVPRAASRALQRSVVILFVVCAAISLLTYG